MFTENVMRTSRERKFTAFVHCKKPFSATFSVVCARNCVILRVFALSDRVAGRSGEKENGLESFRKLKAAKGLD